MIWSSNLILDRATPVTTGQTVSHGHVDQRYAQPPQQRQAQVDQRQQQAPQVYRPNAQHLPPVAPTQRLNPGRPAFPVYPSYSAPAQVPYAPPQGAYPGPPIVPPRGNHVAPPKGGYSVPSARPALPSSKGPSAPSIGSNGPKFLPKNYAKAPDKDWVVRFRKLHWNT